MNQGQGNTSGIFSYLCQACGQTVWSGQMHQCGVYPNYPAPQPFQPMGPPCRAPYMPLTPEDIRKVVREELDRDKANGPTSGASHD